MRDRLNWLAFLDVESGNDGLPPTQAKILEFLHRKGLEVSMPTNEDGPIIISIRLKEING